MTIINLRDVCPFYHSDLLVEVSKEMLDTYHAVVYPVGQAKERASGLGKEKRPENEFMKTYLPTVFHSPARGGIKCEHHFTARYPAQGKRKAGKSHNIKAFRLPALEKSVLEMVQKYYFLS